jgi:hypothetical protein
MFIITASDGYESWQECLAHDLHFRRLLLEQLVLLKQLVLVRQHQKEHRLLLELPLDVMMPLKDHQLLD